MTDKIRLRDYFEKKRLEYKKLASEESRSEDWNYWKGKMAAFKEARDYVSRYGANP